MLQQTKQTEKIFDTPPLNGVLEDRLFLQNIPSMVVAHVLDPRPGEMNLSFLKMSKYVSFIGCL